MKAEPERRKHSSVRLPERRRSEARAAGRRTATTPRAAAGLDPYEAFFDWCKHNGFRDVAECAVEDLVMPRMDAAVAAYAMPSNNS